MAIAHFFWQRYLDKKENISHEMLDVAEITTTAPSFYAILPFTPIVGVLIFDGKWGPQLHIITILVLCMLIAAVLEFVRRFVWLREYYSDAGTGDPDYAGGNDHGVR